MFEIFYVFCVDFADMLLWISTILYCRMIIACITSYNEKYKPEKESVNPNFKSRSCSTPEQEQWFWTVSASAPVSIPPTAPTLPPCAQIQMYKHIQKYKFANTDKDLLSFGPLQVGAIGTKADLKLTTFRVIAVIIKRVIIVMMTRREMKMSKCPMQN